MKKSHLPWILAAFVLLFLGGRAGERAVPVVEAQSQGEPQATVGAQQKVSLPASLPIAKTWTPPDVSKIPHGPRGDSIRLGMNIFLETPRYAAAYVGNQVSCGNCHIQGGTMTSAMPLVGAPAWFPHYSERAGRMITLQDRIQECVTRSENGTPLPPDGPEMQGLLAFFDWLAEQKTAGRGLLPMPDLQGNPTRGNAVYTKNCAGCHGEDGAGVPPIIPPLWGPGAYNDGAGMNQPKKMAAFVLHNMPQNKPGTLTPQEAYDVSAYVASKPHPKYSHAYDMY
jgi:thiosulfate dehydrogenase